MREQHPSEGENFPKKGTRRIHLPSGKTIDVFLFNFDDEPAQEKAKTPHICPECDSHLVQPVDWDINDDGKLEIELQCPNCPWAGDSVLTKAEADSYDYEIDKGVGDMINDLRRLTWFNMLRETELFAAALEDDHILPEDF